MSTEAEQRMFAKLGSPAFMADVRPLLTADEAESFDEAAAMASFASVFANFIVKLPGKPWPKTREMLEKYGLEEIAG